MDFKKFKNNLLKKLVMAIPVMAAIAVTISANSIASPFNGQPNPPKNLKNYRKF